MFRSSAKGLAVVVAVLACLLARPAVGQAQGSAGKSVRELIENATKLYQAGDYDRAASEYFAAYEKKPLPALLFNVAQSHRKAGHFAEALALYDRFLKEDPKSTLAPEAEAHATAVRAQIEAAKSSAERESAERLAKQRVDEAEALARAREAEHQKAEAALLLSSQQSYKKPVYKKAWFWGVIGGVVAAGVIATVVAVVVTNKDPSSDLGVRVVQF